MAGQSTDQLEPGQGEAAAAQPPLRLPHCKLLHGERLAGDPLLEVGDGGHETGALGPLGRAQLGLQHAVVGCLEVGVETRGPAGLRQQPRGLQVNAKFC